MKILSSKYIIRLDDACHQMPIEKWKKFELFFEKYNIKPIVGVIPKNKDNKLGDSYDKNFWRKVKRWENLGWAIAIHGFKHLLKPVEESKTYFSFGRKSEFVSLSEEEQSLILKKRLSIFKKNKIDPKIFMAPSHAFDSSTLRSLKSSTTIKIITDGFSFRTFKKDGFIFIPQQLWSVKKLPYGLYTICIHPSTMKDKQIDKMLNEILLIKRQIIGVEDLDLENTKNYGTLDSIFDFFYRIALKYKFRP